MRLSRNRTALLDLSVNDLKTAILKRRGVIRAHRDMRGDDRCWADDYFVWAMIDGCPMLPTALPSLEEGMRVCRQFYQWRRAQIIDPMPIDAIVNRNLWDNDLVYMTRGQFLDELVRIQNGIHAHFAIGDRPRTLEDDRALYALLPEKLPADFVLPPEDEFLGESKAPLAGCPSFWKSHKNCPAALHNLHQWGPCR